MKLKEYLIEKGISIRQFCIEGKFPYTPFCRAINANGRGIPRVYWSQIEEMTQGEVTVQDLLNHDMERKRCKKS